MESTTFSATINDTLESAAEFFKWVGSIAATEIHEYSSGLQHDIVSFYDNISKSNHKTYHKIKDIINSDKPTYERLKEGAKEAILGLIEDLRSVNDLIWKRRAEAAALAIFAPAVGTLVSPIILCTSILIYALGKITGEALSKEEIEISNMVQSSNDSHANDLWKKAQKINVNEQVAEQDIQKDKKNLLKLANLSKDLLLIKQSLDNAKLDNISKDKFVHLINRIDSIAKEVYQACPQHSSAYDQISLPNSSLQKHIVREEGYSNNKDTGTPSMTTKLKAKRRKLQAATRKLKNKRSPYIYI